MATHDYVIANSTGANVRSDINDVLQAILTNNSSSSSPSTTAAYMFWADTTSGTLKIRNSSDNAWVELLQLDGTLTLEDGSSSTPGLAFRDDLDTGIFSSAANTFNVATAGVERMELGGATIFNENGLDVDFRIEGNGEPNLFFVDAANQRIGIGTATPSQKFHIKSSAPAILFEDTGANGSATSIIEDNNGFLKLRCDNGNAGTGSGIGFEVDASERMRIDSSGKVGIGTTSPGEELVVRADAPSIQFESSNASGRNYGFQANNDGKFHAYDGTAGVNRLTMDSSGNVGIGTSSPSSYNNIADDLVIATSSDTGITIATGTSSQGSLFFADGTSGSALVEGFVAYEHGSNFLKFGTSNTERMRIDSSGKLAVGTTTPYTYGIATFNDSNGIVLEGSSQGRLLFRHTGGGTNLKMFDLASSDGVLKFRSLADNGTSVTERMRIDSSGRVGIQGSPTRALLEVRASGGSNTMLTAVFGADEGTTAGTLTDNADKGGRVGLQHYDTDEEPFGLFSYGASNGTNALNFGGGTSLMNAATHIGVYTAADSTTTGGTERIRITNAGNVGIGTSNPLDKLQVHGAITQVNSSTSATSSQLFFDNSTTGGQYRIRFDSGTSTVGSIQVFTSSTAYNTSSDYRLKENITTITDGITRLKTLIPRRFNFKNNKDKTVDGFIAHEVTAVPESVSGTKDEVATEDTREAKKGDPIYQQIDQSKLVPLLTAALQEAVAKLEVLETKVAALEAA